VIQKRLVDRLALSILEGEFRDGDTVRVEARGGELVFERSGSRTAPAEPAAA
jgi:ATP-dependent Clp protease ATP-binding subunit ClpB